MNRLLRLLLIFLLVLNVAGPIVLLIVLSFARAWFFPEVLPHALDASAWIGTLARGGRLFHAGATSVGLGVATAILATAIALPAGRNLARLRGWHLHIATAAAFLPVVAPPVALAAGLHVLLLESGLGGTHAGVLLVHLVPATGYLTIYFLGVFAVWDNRAEEHARTLGATAAQTVRHVTLPMLRPALRTALTLGFLISWAQVPLTLIAGSGIVLTLPLEVLAYADAGQDQHAAVAALLLTLPPIALMAAARAALQGSEVVPV